MNEENKDNIFEQETAEVTGIPTEQGSRTDDILSSDSVQTGESAADGIQANVTPTDGVQADVTPTDGVQADATPTDDVQADNSGSGYDMYQTSAASDAANTADKSYITKKASKKTAFLYFSLILILVAVVVVFAILIIRKMDDDKTEADRITAVDSVSGDDKEDLSSSDTDDDTSVNVVSPEITPDDKEDSSSSDTDTVTPEPTAVVNPDDFLVATVLGQYIGLVAEYPDTEVSDEDIDGEIAFLLENHMIMTDVTDRACKTGDTVTIDFVGKIDGTAFAGGTASDQSVVLGSGSMIPGFEEGIEGMKLNEIRDITTTFPDDYKRNDELSGKEAIFTIMLKAIQEGTLPELTDEFIAENTDQDSIQAYRDYLADELLAANTQQAEDAVRFSIMQQLVDNTAYSGDIEEKINYSMEQFRSYYDSMANSYYGVDGATLFGAIYGYSPEEYSDYLYTEASMSVKYQHALDEIVRIENFTLTDKEFDDYFDEVFIKNSGYENREAVEKDYTEDIINKSVIEYGTRKKAEDFIFDNAVITK